MDTPEIDIHTKHNRMKREAGTALLISSIILGGFLLLFSHTTTPTPAPVIVATAAIPNAFANLPLHAKAAIVYDLSEHKILFAKNANAQLPLASITKLLTIYTAIHELGINAPITITRADVAVEGDSGFDPGEVFKLGNLARLTLTASVNDGAAAIASAAAARAGTSIPHMLASTATALGLTQTYALNGSGLDSSTMVSGGYGSPYNVALLAGALLKEAPNVAEATTQPTATAISNLGIVHTKKNTDPYVTTMPRILLSKTGYTTLAGGNLVVIFDASFDHPIAVVALGSTEKERFTDVNMLIAATLAHFAHISSL